MRPLTREQLAQLYGHGCTRTFTNLLKKKDISIVRYSMLYLEDQLPIYAVLGLPTYLEEEEKNFLQPLVEQYCKNHDLPPPPIFIKNIICSNIFQFFPTFSNFRTCGVSD
ncbi:MAG: hypothetical protein HC892_15630 [Saprospiraceae bacterium]|nr:hypothetical protein [Saprospiraceae bacterium]